MSHENPLDLIRSMNEQKKTREEESKNLESENLVKNQETIDQEHASLEGQKKVLVEDIEKFKQRIGEIKGTREEMIFQYHEAINEAKKNPETLEYVRENFSDIFREGKEKWQEIRNELDSIKKLEKNKSEEIKNIDAKIEEIFPKTTSGKLKIEQEKTEQEYKEQEHKRKLERQRETIKRLEENIENGKRQKEDYSDILSQKVEYTHEQWASGEAKIISDDATEFTNLWRQFPVHPFVISGRIADCMVEELKNKKYSDKDIEVYKEKREKLKEVQKRIEGSLQKAKPRWSKIGYARSNDIKYPSFPYIEIGHGNHYFDNSLSDKQMTLGELFDKDIEIKSKQLEDAKTELQKIEEEK